jgi:hypothetical protein
MIGYFNSSGSSGKSGTPVAGWAKFLNNAKLREIVWSLES